MSTYQLFIILHSLKDVLVWLVPLLIAILFSVTAFVISSRWIRERKKGTDRFGELFSRIEVIERRIAEFEAGRPAAERGDESAERSID